MLEHPSNPLILMRIELTLALKLDHIGTNWNYWYIEIQNCKSKNQLLRSAAIL